MFDSTKDKLASVCIGPIHYNCVEPILTFLCNLIKDSLQHNSNKVSLNN